MAFARNAGFTSALATNPADTAAGYLTPDRYNLPLVVSGATSGGIPYFDSTTSEASSALLAANSLVIGGGAGAAPFTSANLTFNSSTTRLAVGNSSSGSTGWIIGNSTATTSGLWHSSLTPSSSNYTLLDDGSGGNTFLNAGVDLWIRANNVQKIRQTFTAGAGPAITAGTATTDVNALSVTQTWNAAGVAFTHEKHVITDTASAAGSLAVQYLGGAAGATNLFKVSKAGLVDAPAYAVAGAAGASFGPGAVASITVVNGIITAIS